MLTKQGQIIKLWDVFMLINITQMTVCSAFGKALDVNYNCNICSCLKAIRIMLLGGYKLFMKFYRASSLNEGKCPSIQMT